MSVGMMCSWGNWCVALDVLDSVLESLESYCSQGRMVERGMSAGMLVSGGGLDVVSESLGDSAWLPL